MAKPLKRLYEFGPFRLDPLKRLLWREGEVVSLKPKAFETLLVLLENRGRVMDKDELLRLLWPDTIVEENSLNKQVSALRRLLGESAAEHRYIVTVHGRGYSFVADVRELGDESNGAHEQSRAPIAHGDEKAREPRSQPSIAVLPFKGLGADSENAYLGVGIADALITRLSNIRHLIVRPTSTIVRYTDWEQDPVTIGQQLRVASVLEGSIRKSGDIIRITSQLVSVAEGRSLWAGRFDEKLTDIFTLEDRVSQQIAQVLTPKLTGDEYQRLTRHYTEDTGAYHAYLKGRFYTNKGTVESLKKSIRYFEQAIELDPGFALAYVGLADGYEMLGTFDALLPKECYPKAQEAATRALAIDASLPEAHVALAHVNLVYHWDWQSAEAGYLRALDIAPHLAVTHQNYAFYLMTQGREEAIARIERAQSLDPVSLAIKGEAARIYYYLRHYDEAIAVSRQILEMEPGAYFARWISATCYEQKGEYDRAIAEYEASNLFANTPRMRVQAGYAYAITGRTSEAEQLVQGLVEYAKHSYVSPVFIAQIYIALGRKDDAFRWLEKGCQDRDFRMVFMKVSPRLDRLRSDPRFTSLLQRIGLEGWEKPSL
jgi:TolB-like protein/tetratricopeptide (TPR) repeat protein